jgi:hypothetical protein
MKYEDIMTWNLRDNLFGNLRGPVYDALDEADIQTVGDLVLKTEDEVYRIPGVGAISVHYLKDSLKDYNLKFGWTKEEHEKAILTGLKNPNEIDDVHKDFIHEMINTSAEAAKKSLNIILEKESWSHVDVEKYFTHHLRIINAYQNSLRRLHDD